MILTLGARPPLRPTIPLLHDVPVADVQLRRAYFASLLAVFEACETAASVRAVAWPPADAGIDGAEGFGDRHPLLL